MQNWRINNKKGSEMVEAAITVPLLILTAMLLLRLFTFYLEILCTGIDEHKAATEAMDSYRGAGITKYTSEKDITMLRGGLLKNNMTKNIHTATYMVNEDVLVRAGDAFD